MNRLLLLFLLAGFMAINACNMFNPPKTNITISTRNDSIFVDNKYVASKDIYQEMATYKASIPKENHPIILVDLYFAKKTTSMGTVQDVKRALRKNDLLNVRMREKRE